MAPPAAYLLPVTGPLPPAAAVLEAMRGLGCRHGSNAPRRLLGCRDKLIPMLTRPAALGGDPGDAFTVVAPSMPGHGFSFTPGQTRFNLQEIADVLACLMTQVLGYRRFAAHGHDWGAFISTRLGLRMPPISSASTLPCSRFPERPRQDRKPPIKNCIAGNLLIG
jgi:pimeloyl-ACP methyl ester carboxylesterase